jgi:hypothetical protein
MESLPWPAPTEPSKRSRDHDSHDYFQDIRNNIYRIGTTDNWGCKRCKNTGDKWFMQQHQCKGLTKKQKTIIT